MYTALPVGDSSDSAFRSNQGTRVTALASLNLKNVNRALRVRYALSSGLASEARIAHVMIGGIIIIIIIIYIYIYIYRERERERDRERERERKIDRYIDRYIDR